MREIIVVVGQVLEHEFTFAGGIFVIEITAVVGFGGHFRGIDETHVVEGVGGRSAE